MDVYNKLNKILSEELCKSIDMEILKNIYNYKITRKDKIKKILSSIKNMAPLL